MTKHEPKDVHRADQAGASLRLTAKILGEYRAELKEQGFSDEQVTRLCIEMQRELVHGKED